MIGIQDEVEYCREQIMRNRADDPQAVCDTIREVCEYVANVLCAKNSANWNSVLDPVQVFSKAPTIERINVRIDEELTRIARSGASRKAAEIDLILLLVLKQVFYKLNEV